MLEVLEERGLAATELLQGTELGAESVADMRTRVAAHDFEALVRRAVELTGDPALGLHAAALAPEGIAQIVSHVALAAPTLQQAFAQFARFSPLLVEGVAFSLTRGTKHAQLGYTIQPGLGELGTRFVAEFLTVYLTQIASRRFGRRARATSFGFSFEKPSYEHEYRSVLGAPVAFGQPTFSLEIPLAWLEHSQVHSDTLMQYELGELAERLLVSAHRPVTMVERVRTRLRHASDLSEFDTNQLARDLRMSVRVLRRRLSSEGVTLSELREHMLRERALRELLKPGANVKDITEQLGYSEPSAFHRAFKRWTGLTPSQYVREHRGAENELS